MKWTPEKCDELRRMYNTCSVTDIATCFGCSVTNIYGRAGKIGLKKEKKTTGRPWSDEHVRIMFELWPDKREIARRVGRSVNTVTEHARKNGLRLGFAPALKWTGEQDNLLRELYPQAGRKRTAQMMGLPEQAVKSRAKKMGLRAENINIWTNGQIAVLKEKYPICGPDELKKSIPGHSMECIHAKAYALGLSKENYFWPDDEIDLLKKEFPATTPEKLESMFGRPFNCIYTKAYSIGVYRDKNYMSDKRALHRVKNKDLFLQNGELLKLRKAQLLLQRAVKKNRPVKQKHAQPYGHNRWTDEETAYLIDNRECMTMPEMAAHLNRSKYSVASRMNVLMETGKIKPFPRGFKYNKNRRPDGCFG